MTRFTFDADAMSPVWSPRGDQLAYVSRQDGFGIYVQRADGTGQPRLLLKSAQSLLATDWSPDGKYLLYTIRDPATERDVWYLALTDDGSQPKALSFQQTRFNEQNPVLSPDGRYIAYSSDESGAYEIYVRPFPQGTGRWRVSTNHGVQPRWSSTGREIFYVQEQTLMAAPVTTSPRFEAGTPVALYQDPGLTQRFGPYTAYDVALDGSRIIAIESHRDVSQPTLRVVQNWFAEFRESR
jgi:serine/threonine-protein kinase